MKKILIKVSVCSGGRVDGAVGAGAGGRNTDRLGEDAGSLHPPDWHT